MSTALVHVETMTAVEIFRPGAIDPILNSIKEEVRKQAAQLDISTDANRKAIASLAFKVAKSKTFIDGQRKNLVADEKKRLASIDAEGRRIWNELESLQQEVRKPLTDWEQADKDRIAAHEEALAEIAGTGNFTAQNWQTIPAVAIGERMKEMEADFGQRQWEEFAVRAAGIKAVAARQMTDALHRAEKAEQEKAELERLRAEAAERQQKEREERIAREAAEVAEADARRRAEEAAKKAEAERQRVERERLQAEARAQAAEAARIASEERAEAARIAAQKKAEADKLAAIEAERQRVAEEARRMKQEAETRERNKAHKANILRESMDGLIAWGISAEIAHEVISAITNGRVPHITIQF